MSSEKAQIPAPHSFLRWGILSVGGISQTTFNYTQQKRDDTGLLYYHARYYDPALARFLSADTLVPGDASGKGGDLNTITLDVKTAALLGWNKQVEVRPLTVDFHESKFTGQLYQEDADTAQKGFYFQLDDKDKPASATGKANSTGGKAKSSGGDGNGGGTKCDPKKDPNCSDKNTSKTVRDPGKQTTAKSGQADNAQGKLGDMGKEHGHHTLTVRHGKGDKRRVTKLQVDVVRAIEDYLATTGRTAAGSDAPL